VVPNRPFPFRPGERKLDGMPEPTRDPAFRRRPRTAALRLRGSAAPVAVRVVWPPGSTAEPASALLVFFADRRRGDGRLEHRLHGLGCRLDAVVLWTPPGAGAPSAEDAFRVTSWAAAHAAELDVRPGDLLVGGEGTGAALAGAVCRRARAEGWPRIARRLPVATDDEHRHTVHAPPEDRKEIPMRKVIAGLFVTLDGVTERPEQWQQRYMTPEIGQTLGALMAASDTLVLGRRTYQEWAAFWPEQGSENPFAAQINATPKLVASTTLDTVEWENSTLIAGDVPERLAEIKAQPGGTILINGSATLVRSLIDAGALDELHLLVHPVVAGSGTPLFDGLRPTAMELSESRAFDNGVVLLAFRPAQD
jgi:dihydrofolate reductase